MKRILFFLVFSQSVMFSQDLHYLKLFNELIPEGLKKNEESRQQVETNLKETSSLHPALIYYYLEYLDQRINHNNLNQRNNFFQELAQQKNEYRRIKNKFADDQVRKIKDKNYMRIKENEMISCFDEFYEDYNEDLHIDTNIHIDKNKQNFFIILYLSDKYQPYDSVYNYAVSLDENVKDKVEYFTSRYKDIDSMDKNEKLELMDEINRYWYLFNDNEKLFVSRKTFEPHELAQNIYKNEHYILNKYSINFFYFPVNYVFKASVNDQITRQDIPDSLTGINKDINTSLNITTRKIFAAAIGYRYNFNQEFGAFSYLDTELGLFVNSLETNPPFNTIFYSRSGVRPGEYIDTKAFLEKRSGSNSYGLSAKVLLPAWYFNAVFHIDVGASYELIINKYDYDIIVEQTVTDLYGNQTKAYYRQNRSYSNSGKLNAIFTMNASLNRFFDLTVEADISNYFRVGMGFTFRI